MRCAERLRAILGSVVSQTHPDVCLPLERFGYGALEAVRGFDADLAKARHSKGVILANVGSLLGKEEGETASGSSGRKSFLPK